MNAVIALALVALPFSARFAQAQITYFEGHQRPIHAVAYTGDGKEILTGSFDCTVKVWDRATGKVVRSITVGDQPVLALAVTRDGRRLFAADFGGMVRMYEVPRPYPLPDPLALARPPTAIALSADGTLLATGDNGGGGRLWNLAAAARAPRDFGGLTSEITAVALLEENKASELIAAAADGSLVGWKSDRAGAMTGRLLTPRLNALVVSREGILVGGGEDGLIRVFAWPPLPPVSLTGHSGPVNAAAISPDSQLTATGGADQNILLADAAGKPIRTIVGQYMQFGQPAPVGPVTSLAFGPDSQLIVAGTESGLVKLWDADGTDRYALGGHAGAVRGVAVHPDGKQIASAGADGTVRIWELPAESVVRAVHKQPVQAFALSADGKMAATAAADKTLQFWETRPAAVEPAKKPNPRPRAARKPGKIAPEANTSVNIDMPATPTAVAFARVAGLAAVADSSGMVRIFSRDDGKLRLTLGAHSAAVTALDFHPDSSSLVSAGQDGMLKLWDPATPAPVSLTAGKKPIQAVAISTDGKCLVSGGADGGVRQFDVATGQPIRTYILPEAGAAAAANPAVTSLALDRGNALLAAGDASGTIRLWTTADGEEKPALAGHAGAVHGLAFVPSPRGNRVASAGADGTVRLWQLPAAPLVLAGHAKAVRTIAVSADGKLAVSGGEDGEARLWGLPQGNPLHILRGHESGITRAVFRHDGGEVATADSAGNVRLWNTTDYTSQELPQAHEGPVTSLAYLPGGQQIASSGADGTVRVWQLPLAPLAKPPAKPPAGPESKGTAVAVSADGSAAVIGAADGTVTFVDRASGKSTRCFEGGRSVTAVALSSDNTLVAVGSQDGLVRLLPTSGGREPLTLSGRKSRITAVAFHPKGDFLSAAGADGTVRLWRLPALRKALADPAPPVEAPAAIVLAGPAKGAACVAFAPDGTRLFCGGSDNSIRVWDLTKVPVKDGDKLPIPAIVNHVAAVTCLGISADGKRLFAGAADHTVVAWNSSNFQRETVLKHSGPVQSLCMTPDGTRLATATKDDTLSVWDLKVGRPLQRFNVGAVLGMAFLDNKTVLAGDAAAGLRQYALSAAAVVAADAGKVNSLLVVPDGKSLATAGDDGSVKLWDIARLAPRPADPALVPSQSSKAGSGKSAIVAMAVRDGGRIAAAVAGEGIFLCNAAAGSPWVRAVGSPLLPTGRQAPNAVAPVIKDLAYSADGSRLAVAYGDRRLRLHSSVDGRLLEELTLPATVSCAAFLPKDNRVLAAGSDGRLFLCEPSLIWNSPAHAGAAMAVTCTPDGAIVVSGGVDHMVRLTSAADGALVKSLVAGAQPITAVAVDGDGTRVFAAGGDRTVWSIPTSGANPTSALPHPAPIRAMALDRVRRRLVTCSEDREFSIRAWDLDTGRELERASSVSPLLAVALAGDGKTFVTGNGDGTVSVRTLAIRRAVVAEKLRVLGAIFSADGKRLVSCGDSPGVKLWDGDGKLDRTLLDQPATAFQRVAVSHRGQVAAGELGGARVCVWDPAGGERPPSVATPAAVNCLALSPDGKRLAVGGVEQKLRVYRTSDAILMETIATPGSPVGATFDSDNATLAVAAGSSGIVCRCASVDVLAGHEGEVATLGYTPDGKRLISGGADGTVRIREGKDRNLVRAFVAGADAVTALAVSADGRLLVVGGADHAARVWDLQKVASEKATADGQPVRPKGQKPAQGNSPAPVFTGPDPLATLQHPGPVRGVSVSGDGSRVATAADDGLVRVWDTAAGKELERMAGHTAALCVSMSRDGMTLISGGKDNTPRRWTRSVARSIDGHRGPVRGLCFSPDGKSLFSAGEDRAVVQWSVAEWTAVRRYMGATEPVESMAVSPCGRFVAAAEGPRVRLWDTADGQLLTTVETPAQASAVVVTGGGEKVFVAGADKIIRNYAVAHADGKYTWSLTHQTQELSKTISRLALAVDSGTLYSLCADNTVQRWFMASGPSQFAWAAHAGPIYALRLSPEESRLATGGADRAVRVWNAVDGKSVVAMENLGGRIMDVTFTPDGQQLAACGADKAVRIFDTAGKPLRTLTDGIEGGLYSLATASTPGKGKAFLATAGLARSWQLWTTQADQPLRTVSGHNDAIYRILFSPSGNRLATLDYSGGLCVWGIDGSMAHHQQLPARAAFTMAYSPDGKELAVGTQDHRLLVVPLPPTSQ